MRYSYIHCYSEIGSLEKPNNPVFYCCYMFLVASLMSICFTGNHRQYALFDYIIKLYFVILYSRVLLEINLLLLLLRNFSYRLYMRRSKIFENTDSNGIGRNC